MFTRYLSERVIISQRTFHIHNTSLDLVQSEWMSAFLHVPSSADCDCSRTKAQSWSLARHSCTQKHSFRNWCNIIFHRRGFISILLPCPAAARLPDCCPVFASNSIILFASLSLSLSLPHSQPISQVFTSPPAITHSFQTFWMLNTAHHHRKCSVIVLWRQRICSSHPASCEYHPFSNEQLQWEDHSLFILPRCLTMPSTVQSTRPDSLVDYQLC